MHLLSTIVAPAAAEQILREAKTMLEGMDNEKFQTVLLLEDTNRMLQDLELWQAQEGLQGDDADEPDDFAAGDDDRPAEEWSELTRGFGEMMEPELEEETESIMLPIRSHAQPATSVEQQELGEPKLQEPSGQSEPKTPLKSHLNTPPIPRS